MVLMRSSRLTAGVRQLPRSTRLVQRSHQTSSSSSSSVSDTPSATVTPLYPHSSLYSYSLGLSYASKDSPPFIPPGQKAKPYGFLPYAQSASSSNGSSAKEQGGPSEIGRWVEEMMDLPAGRGELKSSEKGGWAEETRDRVKKWGAGEDFFGVQNVGNDLHLNLSDGVGGWSDKADPSLFSQALCYHYANSARHFNSSTPQELLHKAYKAVLDDKRVRAGGATFVGTRLGEEGDGSFVNLGDSGYAIMRNDQIKFISSPQTHFFNCPLQLSKVPLEMRQNGIIHDSPANAEVRDFEVEAGDVVILFTDGLSDNLPTAHLPLLSASLNQLLSSPVNSHLTPTERDAEYARLLADILVGYGRMAMARTGGEDGGKGWKTPFEIEAKREVPQWKFKGGKVDDITVMTAVVSEKD
ncbi:hypothetical protein I317_05474 [Kwoniella heveanensis CBS 569]|nr:hypothetical protein I317_05474 [Kwoniella heveanensis CBS 569]